jgi:hypothetical protein
MTMKVIERKRAQPEQLPLNEEARALVLTMRSANRRQRIFNGSLLLAMVCVAAAALLLFNRNSAQDDAIVSLVGSLRETCPMADDRTLAVDTRDDCARIESGQQPVVVEQLAGQVGATGATGAAGDQGAVGADGQSPECLATPERCQGADGQPGAMGDPGSNGTDGAPGLSPPCLSQPGACQGNDGRNGADGRDGINGQDGQPPIGWTTMRGDGSVEVCGRATGFDPQAPSYTCTVSGGQGDDGGGLLGG